MRVPDRSLRHRGHGAAAAALAVVVLAGCGGGEDQRSGTTSATITDSLPASTQPTATKSGRSTDTDALLITESISAVFTSADPAKACEDYVTKAYVEKTFGDAEGCGAAQVPAAAANSVDVSAIRVSGDRATADAAPHGGPSNGQSVHVALVYEDAAWRVDSLKSDVPVGP